MRAWAAAGVLGSILSLVPATSAARRAPCTGRFCVAGTVVPSGSTAVDAIEVRDRTVSIASGCPAVRARVVGGRRFTKVVARWKDSCTGVPGKAILKARLDSEACETLTGRLRGKSAGVAVDVAATRSACYGRLDGRVIVSQSSFADVDTADPEMVGDNDSIATAQEAPLGGTIGGAAFAVSGGDSDVDFFRIELNGRPLDISLSIADPRATDLNLFLVDANGVDIVPPSRRRGAFEHVSTTTETGTAFVVIQPAPTRAPATPLPWTNYVLALGQGRLATGMRIAPEADLVPGELVVRLRETTPLPATGRLQLAASDAELVAGDPRSTTGGLFRLAEVATLGAASAPDLRARTLAAVNAMRRRADVEWAEPNYIYQPLFVPDDEFFAFQWHYPLISLPDAWDITRGSSAVTVAVVDTGLLANHPDIDRARVVPGFDFISDARRARDGNGIDDNPLDNGDRGAGDSSTFHGTHVAGTIGAATNNGTGVAGVDSAAKIMPIRVLGVGGGTEFDIAEGIRFAAGLSNGSGTVPEQRADIISMSLGGPGASEALRAAVQAARAAGVTIVVAAGNANEDAAGFSPAGFPEVVTVSATDLRRLKAPYSNFGAVVDVAAPGGDTSVDRNGDGFADGVLSTVGDDSNGLRYVFKFFQGTSMAAPHVAGVAALMQAAFMASHGGTRFTPDEFDTLLAAGALTDVIGPDDFSGHGLINARKAVEAAGGTTSNAPPSLVAVPASVSFGVDLTAVNALLRNAGGGTLSITGVTKSDDADWLAVTPAATLPADAPVTLALTVDRSPFAPGTRLSAFITVTSTAGEVSVPIIAAVPAAGAGAGGDVGPVYAVLVDTDTFEPVAVSTARAVDGYALRFEAVPPGSYTLVAGTDRNQDGFVGDAGEAFGIFPTTTDPSAVVVPDGGVANVTIPVVEEVSLLAGAGGDRGIGRAPRPIVRRR